MATGKNNDPTDITQNGFTKSQSGRCHLALRCMDQEFSFCITDLYEKKHLHFGQFRINNWNTDFEPIYRKEFGKTLFKKATALIRSPQNTLVPEGVYSEDARAHFFEFEYGAPLKVQIDSDYIDGIKAYNIYPIDYQRKELLTSVIPNIRIRHDHSTLIELLSRLSKLANQTKAYVNVMDHHFDLVIFEKNKLRFSNNFNYQTPEDFIYFLLLVFEELEMQFREIPLTFLGKIDESSDLYKFTANYTNDIQLMSGTLYFKASEALQEYMDHEHFILFNQVVCVS